VTPTFSATEGQKSADFMTTNCSIGLKIRLEMGKSCRATVRLSKKFSFYKLIINVETRKSDGLLQCTEMRGIQAGKCGFAEQSESSLLDF